MTGDDGGSAYVEIKVVREPARFVVELEGFTAELDYSVHDGKLVIVHTGVPGELSRRGIGGALVRSAAAWAAAQELVVVPRCPFARWWLRAHPEASAGATIEWGTGSTR